MALSGYKEILEPFGGWHNVDVLVRSAEHVASRRLAEGHKVDAGAAQVGNRSRTTFYRQFQAAYGMTPGAYRSTEASRSGAGRRATASAGRPGYRRVKLIETVMTTGTGLPFSSVGLYSHCRTASSAA